MKTEKHVQESDLTRLRRGELPPGVVLAVTTHLAQCEACRSLDSGAGAHGVIDHLLRDSAGDHPDEATLDAFVDGTLPFDERERVDAHLGICDRCATDVQDLREVAASMAPARRFGSRRRLLLAIAAIVVLAITALVLLRPAARAPEPVPQPPVIRQPPPRSTPSPSPSPQQPALKPEWATLISETIRNGRLPVPRELHEVQASPETVRGEDERRAEAVSPAEEIVETDRPTFTWPAQKNATAVVFVYREDDEVAVSEPVRGNRWTPSKPLPRGVVLVWQVELRGPRDATTRIVPSPPDPPAMFRIIDEKSAREIDEARRTQPGNDLLLGVLYAHAGLKARAVEALGRHASAHPEAETLLRSVQSWP